MRLPFINDLRAAPGSKYEGICEVSAPSAGSYRSHLPENLSSIHEQHSMCSEIQQLEDELIKTKEALERQRKQTVLKLAQNAEKSRQKEKPKAQPLTRAPKKVLKSSPGSQPKLSKSKLLAAYRECKRLKTDFAKEDAAFRELLATFNDGLSANAALLLTRTKASREAHSRAVQHVQERLREVEIGKSVELGKSLQREEDALRRIELTEKELNEVKQAYQADRSEEANKQEQKLTSLLTELELQRRSSSSDSALLSTLQEDVADLRSELCKAQAELAQAQASSVQDAIASKRRAETVLKLVGTSKRFCTEASTQVRHEFNAFSAAFAADCKLIVAKLLNKVAKDKANQASDKKFKMRCKKEILRLRNKLQSEMTQYVTEVERVKKEVKDKLDVTTQKARDEANAVQELTAQNEQYKEELKAMARIKSSMSKVKSMLAFHSKLNDRFEHELSGLKQRYEDEKRNNMRLEEEARVLRDNLTCMEQEVRKKKDCLSESNKKLEASEESHLALRNKVAALKVEIERTHAKLASHIAGEEAKTEEIKRLEHKHSNEIEALNQELKLAKEAIAGDHHARTLEGMETRLANLSNIIRSKDNEIRVLEATVQKEIFERERQEELVDQLQKGLSSRNGKTGTRT